MEIKTFSRKGKQSLYNCSSYDKKFDSTRHLAFLDECDFLFPSYIESIVYALKKVNIKKKYIKIIYCF